jgi:2-iminobutanoate/2-iminopropanoate deaminase
MKSRRREFFKRAGAAGAVGAAGSMALMAQAAEGGKRMKVQGGIRLGNLFFSSGLTGVRPGASKDPLSFGGDVKEQTERTLQAHKANLEALGSSLENVLKVSVFMADVKTEKGAMNEVYAKFFPKDAPARSAFGVDFPDTQTRVEIELVAWIP